MKLVESTLCALTKLVLSLKKVWIFSESDPSFSIPVGFRNCVFILCLIARGKLSFAKLVKDVIKLSPKVEQNDRTKALQNYIALDNETLYSKTRMFPSEQLLEIMASCHSLTYVKDSMIGKDPIIKCYS